MGALAAKGHFLWSHPRFSSLERSPFALQCYQGYCKAVIAGPEVQRRFILEDFNKNARKHLSIMFWWYKAFMGPWFL